MSIHQKLLEILINTCLTYKVKWNKVNQIPQLLKVYIFLLKSKNIEKKIM